MFYRNLRRRIPLLLIVCMAAMTLFGCQMMPPWGVESTLSDEATDTAAVDASNEEDTPEAGPSEETLPIESESTAIDITIDTPMTSDTQESEDSSVIDVTMETPETTEDPSAHEGIEYYGDNRNSKLPKLPNSVLKPAIPLTTVSYQAATRYNATTNTFRLAQAIRKAKAGKPVTIGVLGGSITQGTGASTAANSYAAIVEAFWRRTFPDSPLTFINAGIGATDSYLGMHRVSSLLSANPDFIIVEFSVNDGADILYQNYYDNLVYRILNAPSRPAVLLLFMTSDHGEDASAYHVPTGVKYHLPMISFREAVQSRVLSGEFGWNDILVDAVHPNDAGHSLAARLVIHYLQIVIANTEAGNVSLYYDVPKSDAVAYAHAEIYDNRSLKPTANVGFVPGTSDSAFFQNGWSYSKIAAEEPTAAVESATPWAVEVREVSMSNADKTSASERRNTQNLLLMGSNKDTKATQSTKATEATKATETTKVPTTTTATETTKAAKATTAAETTTADETTTAAKTTTADETTTSAETTAEAETTEAETTEAETTEAETTEAVETTETAQNEIEPEITFTVNAKNIGVLFHVYRDGTGMAMQLFIDGNLVNVLNGGDATPGPDYELSLEYYTSDAPMEHTITIKPAPGTEGTRFAIEGLLLS